MLNFAVTEFSEIRYPLATSEAGPPLYGVLRGLGASGRAQLFKQVFRIWLLKKISIEERLRSADELPPAARKSRRRLMRAGVSGSSLRSPCPLAARRLQRNPAGSTPHGRSGLRWGSSGGGASFACPASSQAPRLKSARASRPHPRKGSPRIRLCGSLSRGRFRRARRAPRVQDIHVFAA